MKGLPKHLTYSDLRNWPDDGNRYELIEGELFVNGEKSLVPPSPGGMGLTMTHSSSPRHQLISSRLFVSLYLHTGSHKLGRVFYAPLDVVFGETTVLQPDILFVSSARLNIIGPEYIVGAPDLVVEILSPQRAIYDQVSKFERYVMYGVGEYWMIDPTAENVETYVLTGTRFELKGTFTGDATLKTPLLPGWELPVKDLFSP
jgi:Uma2 family endonuclease